MGFGNQIIIENEKYRLFGEPLNSYWELIPNKPSLGSLSSSPLDKGYFAKWVIKEDKLFLIDFEGSDLWFKTQYNFEDYFGNKGDQFFAYWFSGTLSIQSGDIIFTNHHFGDTKEYTFIMEFKDGELVETKMQETLN